MLVETEDEAKAIIAKLQSGTAEEGPRIRAIRLEGSRRRSGLENPGMRFVKPFSDAMVGLEKGKFHDHAGQERLRVSRHPAR
ncbi:hypothetical protein [Thauera humireducens]|uniref:hypothetical protein n=1 Tax=Thauera humireducens TaxID=1134435 RepID=UPI00312019D3